MDVEEWRPFLEQWSAEWITAARDPESDAPMEEEVRRSGWLGFAPATVEEVAAAEAPLGRALPPSLRAFLQVSDGWRDAGCFIYRLAGTRELAWLADTDEADWIEAYSGNALDEGEVDDGRAGRRGRSRCCVGGVGGLRAAGEDPSRRHGPVRDQVGQGRGAR